jgi:hypothetical protein
MPYLLSNLGWSAPRKNGFGGGDIAVTYSRYVSNVLLFFSVCGSPVCGSLSWQAARSLDKGEWNTWLYRSLGKLLSMLNKMEQISWCVSYRLWCLNQDFKMVRGIAKEGQVHLLLPEKRQYSLFRKSDLQVHTRASSSSRLQLHLCGGLHQQDTFWLLAESVGDQIGALGAACRPSST